MKTITLVRHAESTANLAGLWQGQGDAALTGEGMAQAAALGARLADMRFDRVVASDLERSLQTAAAAGIDVESDPAWREMDIGEWEGLTADQVRERFPDDLEALQAGEDLPMGGGETWTGLRSRVEGALARLVDELEDGEAGLVVTHGGVIHAAVASVLGVGRRDDGAWPMGRIGNTAMSRFDVHHHGTHLATYNDRTHLGDHPDGASTVIALVRHAESAANLRGAWDGRSDGPLSDDGREQAEALADRLPAPDAVYGSPAQRAWDTASSLAAAHDAPLVVDDRLVEMDFGAWEGMTVEEIAAADPDLWDAIFRRGRDLPRGSTGETFAAVRARALGAIDDIVARHPDGRVAVVTHGVVIRAVVSDVLGVPWPGARSLTVPRNAGATHLRVADGVRTLVDYNV